jgi:hypothetical protein
MYERSGPFWDAMADSDGAVIATATATARVIALAGRIGTAPRTRRSLPGPCSTGSVGRELRPIGRT